MIRLRITPRSAAAMAACVFVGGAVAPAYAAGTRFQCQDQLARQDVTSKTFGPGTVFSVHIHPLCDGSKFGARVGALAKCPVDAATDKPKLPAPGKHCDSVPGHTLNGGTTF